MSLMANMMLPIIIILFVLAAVLKKVNVLDAFIMGAENGLRSLFSIVPSIIALTFAVKLLRGSGVIDIITDALSPAMSAIGIPSEVLPLAFLKSISGSGSTVLLTDIFDTYGPDSIIGLMASVICCSSETTFYTVAVYYGAVGVKNTRHTITAALIADAAAVVFSILFVYLLF